MNKNTVVSKLEVTQRELAHWETIADIRDKGAITTMMEAVDNALLLIEEQDITIRAMLGEFGDSCDAGCREVDDGKQ